MADHCLISGSLAAPIRHRARRQARNSPRPSPCDWPMKKRWHCTIANPFAMAVRHALRMVVGFGSRSKDWDSATSMPPSNSRPMVRPTRLSSNISTAIANPNRSSNDSFNLPCLRAGEFMLFPMTRTLAIVIIPVWRAFQAASLAEKQLAGQGRKNSTGRTLQTGSSRLTPRLIPRIFRMPLPCS